MLKSTETLIDDPAPPEVGDIRLAPDGSHVQYTGNGWQKFNLTQGQPVLKGLKRALK